MRPADAALLCGISTELRETIKETPNIFRLTPNGCHRFVSLPERILHYEYLVSFP